MKKFKNINEVFKYIQSSSVMIMQQIVNEEVIPIILKAIKEEVYDVYDPVFYERRYANDGLLDQSNFDVEMMVTSGFIQATVRNITSPSGDHNQPYLDVMIVEGTPTMPMERDFYKVARDVLREKLPRLVQEKFAKHGIKTELEVYVR